MLGIGQIATRMAELIKGALPFAIVANGSEGDATPAPQSRFARLLSYPTLMRALVAGHKLVFVRQGYYSGDIEITSIANGALIIMSRHAVHYTSDADKHCISFTTCKDITLIGGSFATESGGGGGGDAINVFNDCDRLTIMNCVVPESDRYGLHVAETSDTGSPKHKFIGIDIATGEGIDSDGISVNANRCVYLAISTSGNNATSQAAADGCMWIANYVSTMTFQSGSNYNVWGGNTYSGSISDSGTGNITTGSINV